MFASLVLLVVVTSLAAPRTKDSLLLTVWLEQGFGGILS